MVNVKDVILAILVAYVVLDLCAAVMLKRKRPLLFKHLMDSAKKDCKMLGLCVLVAAAAGGGTYYFLTQQS